MTATELHLAVNHLPIVGVLLGLVLVLFALVRRRDPGVLQAAALVLAISAVGGVAAYLSGEEAEHAAEERGVDHDAIETHEDAGKFALISTLVTAALAGWLAFQTRGGKPAGAGATIALAVVTLWCFTIMVRMGVTGRVLGHPDVYAPEATQTATP